jgi:hypothetical protein
VSTHHKERGDARGWGPRAGRRPAPRRLPLRRLRRDGPRAVLKLIFDDEHAVVLDLGFENLEVLTGQGAFALGRAVPFRHAAVGVAEELVDRFAEGLRSAIYDGK